MVIGVGIGALQDCGRTQMMEGFLTLTDVNYLLPGCL